MPYLGISVNEGLFSGGQKLRSRPRSIANWAWA